MILSHPFTSVNNNYANCFMFTTSLLRESTVFTFKIIQYTVYTCNVAALAINPGLRGYLNQIHSLAMYCRRNHQCM